MTKTNPTPELTGIAAAFSKTFRGVRNDRRYSILGLAKDAGVSNRMIARMERAGDLETTLRDVRRGEAGGRPRQKSAFSRVVVQVALTLGAEPRGWLRELGLEWDEGEYQHILHAAKVRLMKKRVVPTALADGKVIRVAFVPLGPFAEPQASDRRSFFKEFADRVVGSFRYELSCDFKPVPANIRQLLLNQVELSDRPTMIIGFLNVVARELGIWTYCDIPLFRIRMSFLTSPCRRERSVEKLSWKHLLGIAMRSTSLEPRLIVVEESAAELLLRGACRQHRGPWERLGLDTKNIADEFIRLIEEEKRSSGHPVVLAADEVTAYQVRKELGARNYEVDDLSDDDPVSVPSYRLAIAVHQNDPAFTQRLGRIVTAEMFDSHAAVTANLYARYLAHAVWSDDKVADCYKRCYEAAFRKRRRSQQDAVGVLPVMPSFVRLSDPGPDSAVPAVFRQELIAALREVLHNDPASGLRGKKIRREHILPIVPPEWLDDVKRVFGRIGGTGKR